MNPLVAVIVPVFNGASFLGDALASVFAQDYRPLEVIVVDDGSSDDSARIASAFEVLVIRQERRGVATARNIGIAASTAPIVMLLDQDDLWLPAKARLQVEALLANPERVSLTLQQLFLAPTLDAPPRWLRQELLDVPHAGWVPSCVAMTRATFERVGEFDARYQQASDADWFARAKAKNVGFDVIDELLVRRRVHDGNESGAPRAHRELLQVMRNAAAQRRE